ncbi:MAG: exodeoxyribonuclease VII large subunit [Planctomycetaceae bacterium]|jgi:exodeoxyribonuclease VII large subunit|nr:exodeoxyribonuclease VII large subunit [Planctomycetaceae bacterium]
MLPLFDQFHSRNQESEPLTVSELTRHIKELLESAFVDLHVVGEISNLSRPRSGHFYLTLKDDAAQLPAVVWRSSAARISFDPNDGQLAACRGRLDVYPPHGKYQLVIDQMEPLGQGGLELAFRQLHARLEAEGLFATERKKPIPKIIRRAAVVTSPTGAAIRDFLQVLSRRTRRTDILLVPVRVQGDEAALEIAGVIQLLNDTASNANSSEHKKASDSQSIDCIVVTRGGGSIEDLWAFNEEPLVRAVAASQIPIISAVGHEIDVTLCDLAADLRALTPSEAAERIAPNDAEVKERLDGMQRLLERGLEQKLQLAHQKLTRFEEHPFFRRTAETLIFPMQKTLDHYDEILRQGIQTRLERSAATLGHFAAKLDALSPVAVLGRGYSLTFDRQNHILTHAADVAENEEIFTRFADGTIRSVVREKQSRPLDSIPNDFPR